ncbi:lactate utilization protein [uncultured Desulfuromusa sp.]|uniref:LutC/YkgG family protein n=1 Tax=uncultured Desulfuromusa sp. TaxID=219183 RepID=UPI002AA694DD|nr:lactate utilization protein [uncultured Desulfuromusa sp.]
MSPVQLLDQFTQAAINVGAEVVPVGSVASAAEYISGKIEGSLLVPSFSTAGRFKLKAALKKAGIAIEVNNFRAVAAQVEAGITGVNFAIADTGTLVLESTSEDIRLATTLPPKQFALLDPKKIVADGLEAVNPLRQLHQRDSRNYVAYVTGPSRTADIERVLTIGVHGPKELFILLVPGLSDDLLEM